MIVYDFSFRSLTGAQTGRSVLQDTGIASALMRAPRQISEQGCGYVLEVAEPEGALAAQVLRSRQISFRRLFRQYENGEIEDVTYDLF